MGRARTARVIIHYDGRDVTEELSEMVKSVSYQDNTDECDSIEIVFEDRESNWSGDWFPKVAVQRE